MIIDKKKIIKTIKLIEQQVKKFNIPWVTKVSQENDPYKVLVSCILSLRTKDKITHQATKKLFSVADKPQDMIKLSSLRIQHLIYPVGFYRRKTRTILEISRRLLRDFKGRVPCELSALLSLRGVGKKTANLVLGLGYNVAAICVDTHVHRISNRLGWIKTKTPHETEEALKKIIPKQFWIRLNTLLVAFGQNVCVPVSPFCSRCLVFGFCKKRNVVSAR